MTNEIAFQEIGFVGDLLGGLLGAYLHPGFLVRSLARGVWIAIAGDLSGLSRAITWMIGLAPYAVLDVLLYERRAAKRSAPFSIRGSRK